MMAGKLRQRITIQKVVNTNTYGSVTKSWETYKQVWASIDPIKGKEYFLSDIDNAKVSHRIRIRYLSGMKPSMRIMYGTRVFEIETIINKEERNIELEIMCMERIE